MVGGTLNLLSASPPEGSLSWWRLSREKNNLASVTGGGRYLGDAEYLDTWHHPGGDHGGLGSPGGGSHHLPGPASCHPGPASMSLLLMTLVRKQEEASEELWLQLNFIWNFILFYDLLIKIATQLVALHPQLFSADINLLFTVCNSGLVV